MDHEFIIFKQADDQKCLACIDQVKPVQSRESFGKLMQLARSIREDRVGDVKLHKEGQIIVHNKKMVKKLIHNEIF